MLSPANTIDRSLMAHPSPQIVLSSPVHDDGESEGGGDREGDQMIRRETGGPRVLIADVAIGITRANASNTVCRGAGGRERGLAGRIAPKSTTAPTVSLRPHRVGAPAGVALQQKRQTNREAQEKGKSQGAAAL